MWTSKRPQGPAAPGEPMTRGLLFESLFTLGLRAEGALAEALRAEGVDLHALHLEYPLRVFLRCLDLACHHAFPGRPLQEAQRQLGLLFSQGFRQTLVGKVVAVGVPLLGPVRYLQSFPSHLRLDSSPLRVRPVAVGARVFRMEFRDAAAAPPEFIAGILEAGLRRTGVDPTLRVESHGPASFDLHITW